MIGANETDCGMGVLYMAAFVNVIWCRMWFITQ